MTIEARFDIPFCCCHWRSARSRFNRITVPSSLYTNGLLDGLAACSDPLRLPNSVKHRFPTSYFTANDFPDRKHR